MTGEVVNIAVFVVVGVSMVACLYALLKAYNSIAGAVLLEHGWNDDETAGEMFLRVLESANQTLIVRDDGDNVDGSLYNNKRVVAALKRRLDGGLKVRCYFNKNENTLMVRELDGKYGDAFLVRYRPDDDPRPAKDVHCKIADGGLFGHLSIHGDGMTKRRHRLYDCSRASKSARERRFGGHIARFDADFTAGVT